MLTNIKKKAEVCKELGIDIMIDDSINVCKKCSDNNIECILFETPYNKEEKKRFNRINSWEEIYNYVRNKK